LKYFNAFFHIYLLTWVLLFGHTFFVYTTYTPFNSFDSSKLLLFITGVLSVIVQIHLIKLLSFANKKISLVLTSTLLLVYSVLYLFRFNQHVSLDYALLYENFALLFYKESIVSILSMLSFFYLIYALIIGVSIYVLNKKYALISAVNSRKNSNFITIIVVVLMNVALIYIPKENSNPIVDFIKSMNYFYSDTKTETVILSEVQYPYIKVNKISNDFNTTADKPHVFLLFMESYNGLFTDKIAKDSKEVTPYFNKLKKQGLFVEKFYGHSIQTAKGQFSTLSGVYPSVYSKVFTTYPDLNLHALPTILNAYGYETIFTKAYKSLEFDNTRTYAKKLGFKHIESMGIKKHYQDGDEDKTWGWGIQDDIYYTKFFNYLDSIHKNNNKSPLFSSLTTVSNHMMFDKIPENQKYLYPHSDTKYTNFMNSLHLADKYLENFFIELEKREYLKNSIVIITGDHSWPSGEHGLWHNETSFYEEFFKIPLLIIWKDRINPVTRTITGSQIDIAPTILDMLNIQTDNHFLGESLFTYNEEKSTLLVQPYSGTYIVSQHQNMKYVQHLIDKKEYLFDLKNDPKEEENLIHFRTHEKVLHKLRKEVIVLLENQELIHQNRLWPPNREKLLREEKHRQDMLNFSLRVFQQKGRILNLDSQRDIEKEIRETIDVINFANRKSLKHISLGELPFEKNFFTEIEGNFTVNTADKYKFNVASDDGFRLFIDGVKIAEIVNGRIFSASTYIVDLPIGIHTFKLLHFQAEGKVGLQLRYKAASAPKYALFGADSKEMTFGD